MEDRYNTQLTGTTRKRRLRGMVVISRMTGRPVQAHVGNKPVSKKALRKNTKRARKAALNG